MNKIADNVLEFLDCCSAEVGRFEAGNFNINTWGAFNDQDIDSPIEQLLYCAIKTLQKLNFIDDAEPVQVGDKHYLYGLSVQPQHVIDKYRVDFLITFHRTRINGEILNKEVIIECDSQQFHERNERERRYEKARDRYLTKRGYKLFHFTGAEITTTPLKVAAEILAYITGTNIDNLQLNSDMEDANG